MYSVQVWPFCDCLSFSLHFTVYSVHYRYFGILWNYRGSTETKKLYVGGIDGNKDIKIYRRP